MKTDHPALRIAVIGAGPRSLGALEALAADLREEQRAVQIDTFDPLPANAAGPNFDPEESALCLLNTAMRDIDIRAPRSSKCGAFESYFLFRLLHYFDFGVVDFADLNHAGCPWHLSEDHELCA